MAKLDIHDYLVGLDRELGLIRKSEISERNKELILAFVKDIVLYEKPHDATKIKYYQALRIIAKKYADGLDLDKLTIDDLKDVKFRIDNHPTYTAWTKQKFGVILRKFYKWLGNPDALKWWKTTIKRIDRPTLEASAILTEDEVKKLIDSADSPRDKAFISILYELGARIAEIGNMRIKDCSKAPHGFLVDISGKTGHRTPLLIFSISYLVDWLNKHPTRDNPDSPLWITRHYDKTTKQPYYAQTKYSGLTKIVKLTAKKANITKRIYPHLFRHSRATHALSKGELTEIQAKIYFGWTPDSGMLSTYTHLVSDDANKARLQSLGIVKAESKLNNNFSIIPCPVCKVDNPPNTHYCKSCGAYLDLQTAISEDMRNREVDNLIRKLITSEIKEQLFRKIKDNPEIEKELLAIK